MIPPMLTGSPSAAPALLSWLFPGPVEDGNRREKWETSGWGLRVGSVPPP